MPPAIIALMLSAGISVWLYSKLMKYTGNNSQSSIIASVVVFIFCFFVSWAILGFIAGLG